MPVYGTCEKCGNETLDYDCPVCLRSEVEILCSDYTSACETIHRLREALGICLLALEAVSPEGEYESEEDLHKVMDLRREAIHTLKSVFTPHIQI